MIELAADGKLSFVARGQSGQWALTDATRALLQPEFACEDGGLVEVHGFGPTRVWHLGG